MPFGSDHGCCLRRDGESARPANLLGRLNYVIGYRNRFEARSREVFLEARRRHLMVSKKSKQRTGITHFPLEDEKISQRQVPPRGKKKEGASPTTRQGKTGKRLSRKSGRAGIFSSNNDFEGSGGKGGKTGGSRAGLLASRKSSKKRSRN